MIAVLDNHKCLFNFICFEHYPFVISLLQKMVIVVVMTSRESMDEKRVYSTVRDRRRLGLPCRP